MKDPDFAEQRNGNPLPAPSLISAPSSRKRALMSRQGMLPLTGREKIDPRVRWCLRFI